MTRAAFVALALALALGTGGCSTSPPPPPAGSGAPDWPALAGEEVPVIVTRDPDGKERVTKIWVVVVDDQGYVRTGNTRWFRNIERDPAVTFWIGGRSWPLRTEPVEDPALRARILDAFRTKYGMQDRMLAILPSEPNLLRLAPRTP